MGSPTTSKTTSLQAYYVIIDTRIDTRLPPSMKPLSTYSRYRIL